MTKQDVDKVMAERSRSACGEADRCGTTDPRFLVDRRRFLFGVGAAVTTLSLPGWMVRRGMAAQMQTEVAKFPLRVIAKMSELKTGDIVAFNYPWDHPNAANFLMKLGALAGGGIGPDRDIVAFNSFCTHQGGPLAGKFNTEIGVAGPCPLHWTTFDLTRYGMVVAGHATLGLPQIMLELDADDIVATGVMGLIFGYDDNAVDPTTA